MLPSDLEQLPVHLWNTLTAAAGAWRTPVLASMAADGSPDARVVVVRHVFAPQRDVVFYTDRRSRKHAQLENHPDACLVIHDVAQNFQVRLYGKAAAEHSPETLDRWWQDLDAHQRALYAADMTDGHVPGPEKGRENFAAFHVTVDRFHCLWIREAGNEAAEFTRDMGQWRGHRVRP